MTTELMEKYERLVQTLRDMGNVAVAFSGGVDSTLLAKVAHDSLGTEMLAVTANLRSVPRTELYAAQLWCAEQGISQVLVSLDELSIPGFAENPPDRCYLCKRQVFWALREAAEAHGASRLVDGSNLDDTSDYRPGMRALVELGVRSPLKECGFTKADVRALSRELDLPTWNAPSAACLSSRFAYGETITAQKLRRVELAEQYLRDLGVGQLRVRVHGEDGQLARIEVPTSDIARIAQEDVRTQITSRLRDLGYIYVSLDLVGFRSGAMNETLPAL